MADLLSSVLNQTSGTNATDSLVQAYRNTRQADINTLKTKQSNLQQKQSFFNVLKSKIDTLTGNIDSLTATNSSNNFFAKSITSSDNSVMTATATGDAIIGVSSVQVDRLASNDILISQQLKTTDTFGLSGNNLTFKVNNLDVSVNIPSGSTNEDAMKAITNAINNTTNINVSASYIKDTATTGRLTFTAKDTGSANKITFNDSGSGVLAKLGLNNIDPNAVDRSPSQVGTNYAHYKEATTSNLDSQITIDGIPITRGSNTISDVLNGVTLNLLKPQLSTDQPVILNTSVDATSVKNYINPIISSYNDMLTFIKQNQGVFLGDPSINALSSNIRSVPSQSVSSITNPDDPKYLSGIGITTNSDGTLTISDQTALSDALKANPDKVANLFISSDGFANKIKDLMSSLTGNTGLIQSRVLSIGNQIDQTIKKTTDVQANIDAQAEVLRKQYTSLLQTYLQSQNQYSFLSSTLMSSTTGSTSSSSSTGYNSLLTSGG